MKWFKKSENLWISNSDLSIRKNGNWYTPYWGDEMLDAPRTTLRAAQFFGAAALADRIRGQEQT